jgi:hypothetical protein
LSRPTIIAALIAVATVLFAIGTTIERNQRQTETVAQPSAEAGGETAAQHAAEAGGETAALAHGKTTEKLLGVDPESRGLVILAVVVSLLLALAVLRRPDDILLVAVGLIMLAFAALDVREVVHQADENRTGLAVLAGFVAVLHLTAAAACVAFRPGRASATT